MTVKALRGLATVYINIRDVVVGDIIELNEGDFVPADCVLIESSQVTVDESQVLLHPNLNK